MELTIIIPYYNGHLHIDQLINSLPKNIPILVIDDQSTVPYKSNQSHVQVLQIPRKGYFTGAVNFGIKQCSTNVLILNQDTWVEGDKWLTFLADNRDKYGMIGENIGGVHPAWKNGYIQGTFMYIKRDVVNKVGLMNEVDYPLWGSTCEYQLRACRAGFEVLPVRPVPGFNHRRIGGVGDAINEVLWQEPDKARLFLRTPPEISVIATYYNNGKYAPDMIASLIGGQTSLGYFEPQSFQSFEIIMVNDASTDDTHEILSSLADGWKGIRYVKREVNGGSAAANNTGIAKAFGKYISVLGGDDMRAAGSLERVYRTQLENPHSFIYDNPLCFAGDKYLPDMKIGVSDYDFDRLIYKNHIHAGITFPKEAWVEAGGYPESMKYGREDWAMNVALGIKGYCGVRVNEVGYLYRREGQNRSLTNNTPEHRAMFLAQMRELFPGLYRGEKPDMCCGNRGSKTLQVDGKIASEVNKLLGENGMENTVIIEYVGKSWGTQSFYGVATGKRYSAGLSRPRVAVDRNDLLGSTHRPGLLDLREGGKNIFKLVPPAKPQVEAKVEAQPEVEVLAAEVNEPEVAKSELEAIKKETTKRTSKRTSKKASNA